MKKRKGELSYNPETKKLQWNNEDFDSESIYYVPSSLKDEFVEVLITRPGAKPLYIKKTWLTKDNDDIEEIQTLNTSTLDIINKVNIPIQILGENIECRLDGSNTMNKLYFHSKELVSPAKSYIAKVSDIDVVESNSCIIYNFFGPDPVFCFFDALDVIGVLSVTSEWVRLLCMVAVLFWDNFFTLLNIL